MQLVELASFTDTHIKRFKEIVWEKNYNNKLQCNGFVHVDLAPREMPTPQLLLETVFLISCKEDRETKHCFRLLDIKPVVAELLTETAIAASHGMPATDFFDSMFKIHHPKFTWKTKLAIYSYLRIKP